MNLVKAKVVGGKSAGRDVWVDTDSKLTHYSNSDKPITTYKAYCSTTLPERYKAYCSTTLPEREKINASHFWARISEKNLTLIEEKPKVENKGSSKKSLFNDIIEQYGKELLFSVVDENDGERLLENYTFSECKEFVEEREDEPCELAITFTIMQTIKTLKPSI